MFRRKKEEPVVLRPELPKPRILKPEEVPAAKREARERFERVLPASTSGVPDQESLDKWYGDHLA